MLITIITQQVLSLGKLSRLGHLRCGLNERRALYDLGLILLGDSRGTVLRNANPRTPKTVFLCSFSSAWFSTKGRWLPGPHFYSALSSHDARHVPTPHWSPRGCRPPRGDLAVVINASTRAMGLSPGKGQKLLNKSNKAPVRLQACNYKGF